LSEAIEDPEHVVRRLRAAGCVFAEEEAGLLVTAAGSPEKLEGLVARRVGGEPLEHVLGWAELCGVRVLVDARVFVPRQRTAFLVERAVALAAVHDRPVVVDLCCGSGAVGAVVADRVPGVELYASDLDPFAVACARRNLEPRGGRVFCGDLFAALPGALRGRVDVLAVNAPYVPTEAIAMMPPEARDHELLMALDGGPDGLDVHRRVAASAPGWLAPGGALLIETSSRQAPVAAAVLAEHGLRPSIERSDELDATVVIGRPVPGAA
jgi:release factor glutamine methyltransferase